jgi:hypothetical protein
MRSSLSFNLLVLGLLDVMPEEEVKRRAPGCDRKKFGAATGGGILIFHA